MGAKTFNLVFEFAIYVHIFKTVMKLIRFQDSIDSSAHY